jgi:uncharacterized protein YkwD
MPSTHTLPSIVRRALVVCCPALLAVACAGTVPRAAPAREVPRTERVAAARATAASGDYARLEIGVLEELNWARANPTRYATTLEQMLPFYDGNILRRPGDDGAVKTAEGATAVREAIRILRGLAPVPPLAYSPGLSRGARDHVSDQGASGRTGHAGRDGSHASERVERYGHWDVALSENIAYGPSTARDVVAGLIVDDGVADRGHRRNVFDPTVHVAGVACGGHPRYRTMCVIVHAGLFEEGRAAAP